MELAAPRGTLSGTIIKVGRGRGFVLDTTAGRIIVTAAHCLPQRSRLVAASFLSRYERTYPLLQGHEEAVARCMPSACSSIRWGTSRC